MFSINILLMSEYPEILPVQERDDLPKEKPLHENLPNFIMLLFCTVQSNARVVQSVA